jgi:hypothetical protein
MSFAEGCVERRGPTIPQFPGEAERAQNPEACFPTGISDEEIKTPYLLFIPLKLN